MCRNGDSILFEMSLSPHAWGRRPHVASLGSCVGV